MQRIPGPHRISARAARWSALAPLAIVLGSLFASPHRAAAQPAGPLEPPFAAGWCAQLSDMPCRALRLDGPAFDATAVFGAGVEIALLNDLRGVLGFGERRLADEELAGPLPVVNDFSYAVLGLRLRRAVAPQGDGLTWVRQEDQMLADVRLELYRGERAQVEGWLATIPIPSLDLAQGCSRAQRLLVALMPVYLRLVDFAGDGAPELVAGYSVDAAGSCSLTAVRAQDEAFTVLASVGWLPPAVSVLSLARPDGSPQPVLQLLRECCDLEQTLVLGTLGAEGWQWLYRTDLPYALWQVSPDGRRVLAATRDQEAYAYGGPASIAGFELLAYDGRRMARLATASVAGLGRPPTAFAESLARLRAIAPGLEPAWPPSPRFLLGLASLPAWRGYRDAPRNLTAWVLRFESESAARDAAAHATPELLSAVRGPMLLLVGGGGADWTVRAEPLRMAFTGLP